MLKNISNVEHYRWGDACDGWRLLDSASLSVIQERMPPNTSEALHFHNNAQQFFFVIKGVLVFEVENELFDVKAGEGFHILPNLKHRVFNKNTNEDALFLVISEPTTKRDRINLE